MQYDISSAREYAIESEVEGALEDSFDPLRHRQRALEMILKIIEGLAESRKLIFDGHKQELNGKISELSLRWKETRFIHTPHDSLTLEARILELQRERRDIEVRLFQDLLHLEDRRREIVINWGGLLNLR